MQENCRIVRSRWCPEQFCLFTDAGGASDSDALQSGLVCRPHRCAALPLWSGGMQASAGTPGSRTGTTQAFWTGSSTY